MILKRKSEEERFAEALARALEEEHKRWLESLPPEKRRLVLEREKLMLKNSPAWREAEKRIERGEIKLYWRKGENIYIDARDTMKNFPFKRHGDYLLLPSGLDDYMHAYPPTDLDWILAHAEDWRPRALASVKWLEEPVTDTGYDGYYEAAYRCIVEARDGRRFLASVLECMILEECDGKKNARELTPSPPLGGARVPWRVLGARLCPAPRGWGGFPRSARVLIGHCGGGRAGQSRPHPGDV